MDPLNQIAVNNFQEYLRIKTIHPNPDLKPAVEFLRKHSDGLNLEFTVTEWSPDNPIVFLKWNGLNKSLKSIVLYSHMDVVPVFIEHWKHDPFSAHIDDDGNIYGRGSQDMKSVGIQYLEAIRRLKLKDPAYIPKRDVYLMFGPDEEIGGARGMKLFVETDLFKEMNIGIVMDEGIASNTDEYPAFYGDRVCWWLTFIINGSTGHGSQFIKNTAGEKLRHLINRFMEFREAEEKRMIENNLRLGDVTTINLTGVSGGVQHNVVPSPFVVNFDVRITPTVNLVEFQQMIDGWMEEAGGNIHCDFVQWAKSAYLTDTTANNPWWTCFESVCKEQNMKIHPQPFPAGTDGRYIRQKGISAIGFSPMNNTPILLHDHNEYLNRDTFINGITFYEKLIPALANVEE